MLIYIVISFRVFKDLCNRNNTEEEEGRKDGRKEGRKERRKEGWMDGRKEGRKEGRMHQVVKGRMEINLRGK